MEREKQAGMSAAFSFGFVGEDIDDDEAAELDRTPSTVHSAPIHTASLPAKRHSLEDLLSTLPSCLFYNHLDIPPLGNNVLRSQDGQYDQNTSAVGARTFTIPRRSLFDIRTQLMAESSLEGDGNDDLISGLDTGDLSSGLYEGGFKTWECALDLAAFVANHIALTRDRDLRVIELGAGSGVPSLAILRHAWGRTRLGNERIKFTLCDYNEEVLKLVTMPNLLLSWWEFCGSRGDTTVRRNSFGEADLDDINDDMSRKFIEDCKSNGVSFDFVSGGWGPSFVDLVGNSPMSEADLTPRQHNVIILASETIYSPASLATFVDTVVGLLRALKSGGMAFVAAKRIYFGVGGGVPEFVQEIRKVGGSVKEVINITDRGVGRVILEISIT